MAILLWGVPEGEDFTWDLTYKFKSDECVNEATGSITAFPKYFSPTRELKFQLGATGVDALDRMAAFLFAGATIVTSPLWFFRTSLLTEVTSMTSELLVGDASEFYAGEQALIMNASIPSVCELITIDSVAGSTLYYSTPVTYDYLPITMPTNSTPYNYTSAFIMPVISGILEYEGLDYISGLPGLGMKAKIDGGVWNSFVEPTAPDGYTFLGLSMDAKYNSPKIVRDLCGAENGIISMYAHGSSSKLTFECTWHFKDSSWKTLRDAFFVAKGKSVPFYISTNMYELVTTRGSDAGSTTIFLNPGYQYLWERYPYILVQSSRTGIQSVVYITAHVYRDEFACEPLPYELYDGDRGCFFVLGRFDSDELTFSFKGLNMCYAKAIFIEEYS
jgi:hypothetical protein